MKRFSFKVFTIATVLHIVASIIWMSSALSASFAALDAERHGMPIPTFPFSLTIVSWILLPIPRLLSHYFAFRAWSYFYCLMLPWSICVGVGFGFLVPYLSRWRNQIA